LGQVSFGGAPQLRFLFSRFRKYFQIGNPLKTTKLGFQMCDSVPFRKSSPFQYHSFKTLQLASKPLSCKHLRFLTRYGTRIAFRYGMNSEMNMKESSAPPAMEGLGVCILNEGAVRAMRHSLHELANVFTGLMITGGLLSQLPSVELPRHYLANLCEGSERGSALVRELRSQLLAACGEAEAMQPGQGLGAEQGRQKSS
jgi:hypothetical protein